MFDLHKMLWRSLELEEVNSPWVRVRFGDLHGVGGQLMSQQLNFIAKPKIHVWLAQHALALCGIVSWWTSGKAGKVLMSWQGWVLIVSVSPLNIHKSIWIFVGVHSDWHFGRWCWKNSLASLPREISESWVDELMIGVSNNIQGFISQSVRRFAHNFHVTIFLISEGNPNHFLRRCCGGIDFEVCFWGSRKCESSWWLEFQTTFKDSFH